MEFSAYRQEALLEYSTLRCHPWPMVPKAVLALGGGIMRDIFSAVINSTAIPLAPRVGPKVDPALQVVEVADKNPQNLLSVPCGIASYLRLYG